MRSVDDFTPEQTEHFSRLFHALKRNCDARGEKLALTPEQRSIAIQLGLIPYPAAMAEVMTSDGNIHRGLLVLCDDDIYRGAVHAHTNP